MKKFIKLLIPLFSLSLLSGCNTRGSSSKAADYKIENPSFNVRTIQNKEDVTYLDLFNLNNKVDIVIDVDREEMQKINDDNVYSGQFDTIKPETYHLAKKFTLSLTNGDNTFTWELENVGIRQKGNTSRKPIFAPNGKLYNKNHFKISFDETFDDPAKYDEAFITAHGNQEYKSRELLGLSGIDIKWNKTDDTTHLKEIYANMVLRSAGVLAQHVGLSTMKMTYDGSKEANFGLCYIYEQTSKDLIKNAFQSETKYINSPTWGEEKVGTHGVEGSKYGDLYKASYGKGDGASSGANFTSGSISGKRLGVKTDIEGRNYPTYERKTDKKKDYGDNQIKAVVAALNGSSVSYSKIDELVDLEYLAMEEAVMYFLGNPDSMKYNYNNYMVYFRRTDGKMMIIPIDNDRCFGVGNGWDSGLRSILDSKCTPTNQSALNGSQNNPLLKETIFAVKENQSSKNYKAALKLVKESVWLKNETFERYYNILKVTYDGLADFSLDGGSGNMSFSSFLQVKTNLYEGKDPGSYTINPEITQREYYAPEFPTDVPLYAIGSQNSWGEKVTEENKDSFLFTFSKNKTKLSASFEVLEDEYAMDPNTVSFFIQDQFISETSTYCYGVLNEDPEHIYKRVRFGEAASDSDICYPAVINVTAAKGDIIDIVINIETGEFSISVNA